jgi:hypothetical protein
MLGHKDPAMTLRRYSHVLDDMSDATARRWKRRSDDELDANRRQPHSTSSYRLHEGLDEDPALNAASSGPVLPSAGPRPPQSRIRLTGRPGPLPMRNA